MEINHERITRKTEKALNALISLSNELRPHQSDPDMARLLEAVDEAMESVAILVS